MKNLKEIKTTIIGSILFIIGLAILVYQFFWIGLIFWKDYLLSIGLMSAGIGFLLVPDRLINFIFNWNYKRKK